MKSILYDTFNDTNDTAQTSSLKDTDLRESENMDFAGGGMVTRPGSAIWAATASAGGVVTQIIEFIREGVPIYFELAVVATVGKLYRIEANGALTELLTLKTASAENEVWTFQLKNVLWIGTGAELYSLGMVDYTSATGTVNLNTDDVVRNVVPEIPAGSMGIQILTTTGVAGAYYRAKGARTGVDLSVENYTNTTNWTLLTGPAAFCRPVRAFDAGKKEKVKLVIGYNASAAANVTVTLNKVSQTIAIAAGDTATAVAGKIRAAAFSGWTLTGSGSTVYFEAAAAGAVDDTGHEYDAGTTGAYGVVSVSVQGKTNDNDLAKVRKCRVFLQHPLSKKVFAIGNPDDPTAVYISGTLQFPDDPTYWSSISTLYPTTPEGAAIGMVLLSESLLVSFSSNWYAFGGVDLASDSTWRLLNLPIGAISPHCIVSTPNSFTFLGRTGLYSISAGILNTEVLLLQGQDVIVNLAEQRADKFFTDHISTTINYTNIVANTNRLAYYDDQLYLAGSSQKVLIYDTRVGGWKQYAGWTLYNWCPTSDGNLLFASLNYPMQTGVGTKDNGVDIRSWLRTKDYDMGNALSGKYLLHVYLLFKQYVDLTTHTADIKLLGDYLSNPLPEVPLDGTFVWGTSWGNKWGSTLEMMELVCHPNVASRVFGLTIESYDKIGFFGVGFSYNELRPRARDIESGRSLIE